LNEGAGTDRVGIQLRAVYSRGLMEVDKMPSLPCRLASSFEKSMVLFDRSGWFWNGQREKT